MKKAIINFEDKGQDCTQFTAEFYPDFLMGYVRDSDMQKSIWKDMCILSGKPEVGQYMTLSKSPGKQVMEHKYKITSVKWL